jgi:predicted nucleic acid-binding protein
VATYIEQRRVGLRQLAAEKLFSEYHTRLGGGDRNIGESATLAYAELHGLTACIDDRAARRHGQERGVPLTGTLELVCRGIRANIVEEAEAARVVDLLRDHEAFLPCDGSTFLNWARAEEQQLSFGDRLNALPMAAL